MENSFFISKVTLKKLTAHFHILSLQLFDQKKSVIMKVKSAHLEYGRNKIKYLNE